MQAGHEDRNDWTGVCSVPARHGRARRWLKGLYHWAPGARHRRRPRMAASRRSTLPWQAATIFFAVIDLVAAVGLWLAAAWGAVVWLTAAISMVAVELFFPQVFGGRHRGSVSSSSD